MDKEKTFDFSTNWYEVWMKQSKQFFETADKNLKGMFEKGSSVNPEDHLKQIQQWLDNLKAQWQFTQLTEQQRKYENYWKMMIHMCNEASELMLQEWIKRAHEPNPVKNIHDLYELWLNCCQKVYEKSMHTPHHQDFYGDYMNAVIQFWKSSIPK